MSKHIVARKSQIFSDIFSETSSTYIIYTYVCTSQFLRYSSQHISWPIYWCIPDKSSNINPDKASDIYPDKASDISWSIFWHKSWQSLWHISWQIRYPDKASDIYPDESSDVYPDKDCDVYPFILTEPLPYNLVPYILIYFLAYFQTFLFDSFSDIIFWQVPLPIARGASVTRVVGTLAEELRNAHKNSGRGGRGNYICHTQKLYTIYTKENPINRLLSGTTLSQLIELDQFGTFSTPAPPKKASRIIIPIFCGCKQQFVTSLWPQRVSNISIFRSPGSTFRC